MDIVHIIRLYMFNDIDISFRLVLTYAEMWMSGGGGNYRSYSFSDCLDQKCKLFGIIRTVRFVFQFGYSVPYNCVGLCVDKCLTFAYIIT